ncbi:hypothetical protein C6A85_13480, partial [Mycobacterium sp. ITM-2017-0098]
ENDRDTKNRRRREGSEHSRPQRRHRTDDPGDQPEQHRGEVALGSAWMVGISIWLFGMSAPIEGEGFDGR